MSVMPRVARASITSGCSMQRLVASCHSSRVMLACSPGTASQERTASSVSETNAL